ncbi:SpoIID/LytB domain-containing protein [Prolixibacteraceae bacterium JC049]|nr:SpoIID/LytB domain-containing protein [Prolixibacteraceae bacterium JC049]
MKEPKLNVGIMSATEITFQLNTIYNFNSKPYSGEFKVELSEGKILFEGETYDELYFSSSDSEGACFDLYNVTIGVNFHWEREENQRFKGDVKFIVENDKLTAINGVNLEDYLTSVISSEMSATSNMELLKAHAIISRSWLMAQVIKGDAISSDSSSYCSTTETAEELIRWYDREDHANFNVCADDHCQRYQGITRQSTSDVEEAIAATRGWVLMYNNKVCDARFSKCCGGVSENFEDVWEPVEHNYLKAIYDASEEVSVKSLELRSEENADEWIRTSPDVFCNCNDQQVLSQVLNDYDQETNDFFRWEVKYSQQELSELLEKRTGKKWGQIIDLIPMERGESGRLIRLKIVGDEREQIIGKELEIRKSLSESHLYSSAFVIDKLDIIDGIPQQFVLTGCGWGHGVGLCQIGAAVMGAKGYNHTEILTHYFKGASLNQKYQ